jgi:hypothetical protein
MLTALSDFLQIDPVLTIRHELKLQCSNSPNAPKVNILFTS